MGGKYYIPEPIHTCTSCVILKLNATSFARIKTSLWNRGQNGSPFLPPHQGYFPQPKRKNHHLGVPNGQFVGIHRHTHQVSKETTPKILFGTSRFNGFQKVKKTVEKWCTGSNGSTDSHGGTFQAPIFESPARSKSSSFFLFQTAWQLLTV